MNLVQLVNPGKVLAETIDLSGKGPIAGKIGLITPGSLISGAIQLVMTAVAIAFFAMLVMGGLKWVVSEGDKNNVEGARNQVTNALIGLAIVFSSYAVLKLLEIVFGVKILTGLEIPSLLPQ